MSECSLSRRGQGHVSNFYIVDLENFAPPPLEVGPKIQLQGLGSAVSSPSGVWGGPSRNRIWCISALKHDIWWQQFSRNCTRETTTETERRYSRFLPHPVRGRGPIS